MARSRNERVKRNDPCPCGSGLKYKRCCGRLPSRRQGPTAEDIERTLEQHKAQEAVRQYQQGKGRPIISAEVGGQRLVAVGNRIYYGRNHKTFVDFLPTYLASVMGSDWGNGELKKAPDERHQIVKWYVDYCAHQKAHMTKPAGEIQGCPTNGLTYAYLGLAYNLYLLDHNAELQAYLVRRLKQPDTFYAAYYETHVAAWFILAGFTLAIENEEDSTRTHAEFIASQDGRNYSVEAKTRRPEKSHFDVGNQLWKALRKEAKHPRIVFIDMNVDPNVDYDQLAKEAMAAIKGREAELTVHREPAPPAYVFVTNQPCHLALDLQNIPRVCLQVGFKIPDFGYRVQFPSFIAAHKAREKHGDAHAVYDAFVNYVIPITFDGGLPEFAFGDAERRFIIGERYEIVDGVLAKLTSATVMESEKKVYLAFHTDDDKAPILTADLTDAELAAYQAHPDTFFGRVVKHHRGEIEHPMDMFDFFREGYKDTPKERLLGFFKDSPDLEELKKLPVEELRLVYAERCTLSVIQQGEKRKRARPNSFTEILPGRE